MSISMTSSLIGNEENPFRTSAGAVTGAASAFYRPVPVTWLTLSIPFAGGARKGLISEF